MKMRHSRLAKEVKVADAVTFLAGDRTQADGAVSGDIIGLHNHGTIQIGDTFTTGEELKFRGIPHFARPGGLQESCPAPAPAALLGGTGESKCAYLLVMLHVCAWLAVDVKMRPQGHKYVRGDAWG